MATATQPIPELPPEIQAQMDRSSQYDMYRQPGQQGPNTMDLAKESISELQRKVGELEKWTGEVAPMIAKIDPTSKPIMIAIVTAGKELAERVKRITEQAVPPGQSPVNRGVPGANVPNPAESIPNRPIT